MKTLDQICKQKTGFKSFADLLESSLCYRPSIDRSDADLDRLADAYDREMEELGDTRRAYRYGQAGLSIGSVPMRDIIEAIRDAKRAVREVGEGFQIIASSECQISATDEDGQRIERFGNDFVEGFPTKRQIARLFDHAEVSRVWVFGNSYELDTSLPLKERHEERSNTGDGWDVEIRR